VAAVAVAVQPIIQKCLVEIRRDDLPLTFLPILSIVSYSSQRSGQRDGADSVIKNPTLFGWDGVATLLLGCVPVCALALGRYGYLASLPCGLLGFLADWLCCRGRSRSSYGGCCLRGGCWLLHSPTGTTNDLISLEDFETVRCQVLKDTVSVGSLSSRDQTFRSPGVGCITGVDAALPVGIRDFDKFHNLFTGESCADVLTSSCFDSG
jgi:hypothetical protein